MNIERTYHVDTAEQAKVLFAEDIDAEYEIDTQIMLRDFVKVERVQ